MFILLVVIVLIKNSGNFSINSDYHFIGKWLVLAKDYNTTYIYCLWYYAINVLNSICYPLYNS